MSNVPDGIYKDEIGERIALEIEVSQKSKADYQLKIKKYVAMMRSKDTKIKVFDRVVYVVAKPNVVEYLIKETKIFGDLFTILTFDQFFKI